MATKPPDLDAKLADALERTGHALRVLVRDQAQEQGLSPIQVQLLLLLADEPGERRRVTHLAAALDVRPPTVSDAVAALRRKGLVVDEVVPDDRRARQLALTRDGARVAGRLGDWATPVLARLAGQPADAKAQTLALVLDLLGGLQEDGVLHVARTCTTCRFFLRDGATGTRATHRCALLELDLAAADLRVDCPEHELAAA